MYHRLYTSHVYACLHVCVSVITNTLFQLHKCVAERQTGSFHVEGFYFDRRGADVCIHYVRCIKTCQVSTDPPITCLLPPSLPRARNTTDQRSMCTIKLPSANTHAHVQAHKYTQTHTHTHTHVQKHLYKQTCTPHANALTTHICVHVHTHAPF